MSFIALHVDMTLSGMSAILDPLRFGDSQLTSDDCSRHSESDDERQQDFSTAQVEKRSDVLHWSTEQVTTWLQENVPFGYDRMQECLHVFHNKGVDGLGLLTLQRNHRACLGMSDFEWLLFKSARKRLLSGDKVDPMSGERLGWKNNLSTSFWTPPCTPRKVDSEITPPGSPQSLRSNSSNGLRRAQGVLMLSSPQRLFSFPKLSWNSDSTKDEQIELLVAEVQSLRGEVVSAEERETTLQAQMHHVDDVLRTAILSGYLNTRTRWMPLVGEPLIDDTDVNDWLQRFLVLQGSSIFFYLHATDLRPQGTILLEDVVEVGVLPPAHMQYKDDSERWFSFHITTCHGLRLECSTPLKLQMDSWLTSLGVDFEAGDSLQTHDVLF